MFGVDARRHPVEAKRIVAWLPDEPQLYDKLDPIEYLEFVAGLWGVEPALARRRADELLESLGLWPNNGASAARVSPRACGRRTALAGALIHEPKLLMLDEPLTGLDAASARQVKDMLAARVAAGAAVMLTTHILEVAERIADRIGILARGRLVAEGTFESCAPAAPGRRWRTCSSTSLPGGGVTCCSASSRSTSARLARAVRALHDKLSPRSRQGAGRAGVVALHAGVALGRSGSSSATTPESGDFAGAGARTARCSCCPGRSRARCRRWRGCSTSAATSTCCSPRR